MTSSISLLPWSSATWTPTPYDPDFAKKREHSWFFAGDEALYYANVARARRGLEKDRPDTPRPNTSTNGLVEFPCRP